jgi:hypothetical protein
MFNSWSTESIFNQFSVFLKTLNALCVCLQYKHPRSIKRVIRSGKPITSVFPVKSQQCDFGAEPRCRLFATSAGKGLKIYLQVHVLQPLAQMNPDSIIIFILISYLYKTKQFAANANPLWLKITNRHKWFVIAWSRVTSAHCRTGAWRRIFKLEIAQKL